MALTQQVLVRQHDLHQIRGHGVAGFVGHQGLVSQARCCQLRVAETRCLEHFQGRRHVGYRALVHAIQDGALLGAQLHVAVRGQHGRTLPTRRRDQHHVALHFGQGDAARALGGHAALAQDTAVDADADRTCTRVEFDALADDA